MCKIGIIRSLKNIFKRKQHFQDQQTVPSRQDWNRYFSYSFGKPDDEETRRAFRLLKELKQKYETGNIDPDNDSNLPI